MLILYDFECATCFDKDEALAPSPTTELLCESCGGVMSRIISPVRSKLDGTDPGFPDAYDKWARQHEEAGKRPS